MTPTPRTSKFISFTVIASLATVGLAACGGGAAGGSGEEIPVGLVANLTGQASTTFGKPFANGFEMALEDANEAGVLEQAGISLDVITEDSRSETGGAVTAFNTVSRGGAPIVIQDSQSPLGQAIAPLANDQGTALLSGAGSELENPEGYAFRFTDLVTTTESVSEYLKDQGHKRVGAIVATDNPSFDALANASEGSLENGFVIKEEIASSDTNFASVLENIRNADVDAVVLSVLPAQVGNILVQMEQSGGFEEVQPVGTLATGPEAFTVAGAAAEDLIFPQAWAPGGEASAEFEAEYAQTYSEDPTAYAGLGYQIGWITVASLIEARPDGEEVTGALVRDAVPGASTGEMVQEHGILDLELKADGTAVTTGTMAKFDSDGNIVSLAG
jgi:branched-chain amino acid transport system substrate-binding protein